MANLWIPVFSLIPLAAFLFQREESSRGNFSRMQCFSELFFLSRYVQPFLGPLCLQFFFYKIGCSRKKLKGFFSKKTNCLSIYPRGANFLHLGLDSFRTLPTPERPKIVSKPRISKKESRKEEGLLLLPLLVLLLLPPFYLFES